MAIFKVSPRKDPLNVLEIFVATRGRSWYDGKEFDATKRESPYCFLYTFWTFEWNIFTLGKDDDFAFLNCFVKV